MSEELNRKFVDYINDDSEKLQAAIDWISDNLDPEDVFTDDQLEKWSENNDYVIPRDKF